MINNPIFSIIVPVYNVEPYLERCLESIANQTLKNIEVIIVYDPSTDESLNICQSFLEKYTNFRLHFGTNNGAGAARNYGFDQAGGKFICYVDSDDWIEPNLCSDMLLALNESGADFVNFGLDFFNNDGKILITKEKFSRKTLQGENIFRKAMLDDDILTVVWNKVYRRSFLIENQIRFPEVKEWEDILYSRKVAYFSHNTYFVSKVYYHALVRNDSRSRTISSSFLLDGLSLLRIEHQFISTTPDGGKFDKLFKAHFIKHISFFLIKAAFQVQSRREYIQCFRLIGNSEYSIYINQSEVKALLPKKNRIMVFVCKYPRTLRLISSILKKAGVSPY
jgi:glycosyltransferase involved in cell wall biosynthesis